MGNLQVLASKVHQYSYGIVLCDMKCSFSRGQPPSGMVASGLNLETTTFVLSSLAEPYPATKSPVESQLDTSIINSQ